MVDYNLKEWCKVNKKEHLLKEWNHIKNDKRPDEYSYGSGKRVWWICSKGHEYDMPIQKKTIDNRKCPYCSGKRILEGYNDLYTLRPDLMEDWDFEKNIINPKQVALHSNKFAWWKCHKCGNSWKTKIEDRTYGKNCPKCSKEKRIKSFRENNYLMRGINDLASQKKELLEEWDYERNATIKPEDFTINSRQKVWWKCKVCNNVWQATISNRVNRHSGCPICMKHKRTSFPEQAIFYYLEKEYNNVENSYIITDKEMLELDVYIPDLKMGIEYDGKAWHGSKSSKKRDSKKNKLCKDLGISLIRIAESERSKDIYDVIFYREQLDYEGLNCVIKKLFDYLSIDNYDIDVERDRATIMKRYINHIKGKSILAKYPKEAKYFSEKNEGLTPDMINATSNVKYWWKCDLGHDYLASPANRLLGNHKCPYCACYKVLSGYNDLATRYPKLVEEWDYKGNYPLTPDKVMPGSQKKVFWLCKLGHSYKCSPNEKIWSNPECPYCSYRETLKGFNDLVTTHPELIIEWDHEKNEKTPDNYNKKNCNIVWWKCKKNHIWKNSINARANGYNCPYCANQKLLKGYNDLETISPDIAKEWNYEKNKELKPSDVINGSGKRVWWKCSICNYEWNTRVYTRTSKKTGCPKCGYKNKMQETIKKNLKITKKDLETMFPEIAKEWDYNKNEGLKPNEISFGANKKVWWRCSKGHSYQAWISDRTGKHKSGCPYCAGKRRRIRCVETGNIYDYYSDAAEATGINKKNISACCNGRNKTAGNLHWEFVDA